MAKRKPWISRRWKLLAAALGLVLLALLLRPADRGAPYEPYFAALNQELLADGPGRPVLVLDLDRLDRNIDQVAATIRPPRHYRVVAKSLPSVSLIRYVFERAGTNRAMVFHQPFINELAAALPGSDLLLGKPLPVTAAARFYATLATDAAFDPDRRLAWLVDSDRRLGQYQELARRLGRRLRINVEIDVGLHRGGLRRPELLEPLLARIAGDSEHLAFAGFMGYDAHVAHAPPVIASREGAAADVVERYGAFVAYARDHYPELLTGNVVFNGAGSKTYRLYGPGDVIDDLSAGSGLVKPMDFDVPTLRTHEPAIYIAAPVLKALEGTRLPFVEFAAPLIAAWNPNRQRTYFIYGGKWMAEPVSPAGLIPNPLFGSSSNQDIYNGSAATGLAADDHVFLRPTQSEAVMLRFGDLRLVRDGELVGTWDVFEREGE